MRIGCIAPYVPYRFAPTPYPPLGIGYLIATIRQRCSFVTAVSVLDGQVSESEERYWLDVDQVNADVVLLTATIRHLNGARRTAARIKTLRPSTVVIMGGPGPSALAAVGEHVIEDSPIDIALLGEAENLLPRVLECIERAEDFQDIQNLIVQRNGRVGRTSYHPDHPEITTIPWPDRSLFDESAYLERWQASTGMTSVHLMGSRGCPMTCSFCDRTVTGNRMRNREPDDVADEMAFLEQRYHPDDIFYFDDLFTFRKRRVLELCRAIASRGVRVSWSAQGRVGAVDEEMIEAMWNAGCTEMMFGVESGSNRILERLNKRFTRDDVLRTFGLCHRLGMKPGAYLIVGVPGESRQDILETVDLVERIEPSLLNFSFLTPFPNTPLYTETKELIGNWDYESWDDFEGTVYTCSFELDPRAARDLILDAYRRKIETGMEFSSYQFACEHVSKPVTGPPNQKE